MNKWTRTQEFYSERNLKICEEAAKKNLQANNDITVCIHKCIKVNQLMLLSVI